MINNTSQLTLLGNELSSIEEFLRWKLLKTQDTVSLHSQPTESNGPNNLHDKLLVTAEEAAQLLSVGRTTIYSLLAKGLLESVIIGRSRRIPVDALHSYVKNLRRPVSLLKSV